MKCCKGDNKNKEIKHIKINSNNINKSYFNSMFKTYRKQKM